MSTATESPPKTCVYCGSKQEKTDWSAAKRNRGGWYSTNFGACSAKGLDCCDRCWRLKYPDSRIPSTSISASGITHEHSLMKCGHSFVDSKPLRFKFPKLADLLPNIFPSQGANEMTVSELDLGSMSAEEAVETLHDNADKLNGEVSKDETELLVEKLANLAEQDGVNVSAIKPADDARFSAEEQKLFTAAVQERAERLHAQLIQATLDKHRAKYEKDICPILPKREDGYWLDTSFVTPDVPEQGPYPNKSEAEDARQTNIKMFKREQKDKETNGNRKSVKQKAAEIANPSPEDLNPSAESEQQVSKKTTSKKKKAAAPKGKAESKKKTSPVSKAAAAHGNPKTNPTAASKKSANPKAAKPAKAPKAEKAPRVKKAKAPKKDRPPSCIEAAVIVLKASSKPLTVPEILEKMVEKKLWSPGDGKTPVATINAKLCLEMSGKGKDSRVKRTGVGTYAAT